ncbi:PD40 domain-containing protein [Bdellovibrio sp. SKB1291214]|uniref:PD40 domain-containing protein n=1 Tax=Bdellovibrio sp. SKB1291214 TaxID=1732569 RepID=UPI000B514F2B|nr:PD40 domain-containing protein [Bdellovibrio sp. SKB1291214]UYL09163.1 PD40 domain-containing protein [Bdellovibrio sp. SKB1291214]
MQVFLNRLLVLLCLLAGITVHAQWEVQPRIKWKTLSTPHFEIIYNAEQPDLGRLYAEKLERAYYQLQIYFSEAPPKTVVVINDKTDVTNGYATRLPYPHIMAYPVLPGPEESLADTGDWAFELLAHEYTHILNFEPAGGVMTPLRAIFGTVIAPNLVLPNWWKEGLAVEMETRLGNKGRLRSSYQDSVIRALVEDQRLFHYTIAEINENIPSWPEGARPYIFGSLMWSQILADQGAKVVDALNQRHGRRIPFFIETPAKENLGMEYAAQYAKALNETEVRALTQLKTLREVLPTPYIPLRNAYLFLTAPSISPDGKRMAVVTEDDSNNRAIKIIVRENLQTSFMDAKETDTIEKFDQNFSPSLTMDEPPSGSIQRVSWFPDSAKIVYDKIDVTNKVERFSDLFQFDIVTQKTSSLTRGLRAREPAVSLDGKKITFVKLEGGKTSLATLNLEQESKEVKILFDAPLMDRISYPTFWNDDTIVFSLRRDGQENLHTFRFSTGKVEKILAEYPDARFPRKTIAGLIFTSSKNGAQNIYIADPTLQSAKPMTHTLTSVFSADLDPTLQELFATSMTSQGLKVVAYKAKDWKETPEELPQISPLLGDRYTSLSEQEKTVNQTRAEDAVRHGTIEDYSAAGYLWPRFWVPFIAGSSSDTGLILQALTTGFDPLKKHSYSLTGTWDTGINRGGIDGSYVNQTTNLPFMLSAYTRSSYLGTIDNKLTDNSVAGAIIPDMFWLTRYASLQAGWQYFQREVELAANPVTKRTGPYAFFAYTNYSKSGAQISPESGGSFYLGAYNYIQYEDYLSHSQFIAGITAYNSRLLPKHHSLLVRLNGMYTPEKISSLYGASSQNLVLAQDSALPQYILRGYSRGQIYGRNMASFTSEYRFPVMNTYKGPGTLPLFFRRISGALTLDGMATDGVLVNDANNRVVYNAIDMKRSFWSAGIEGHLETTLGYIAPVRFIVGVYQAFNDPKGSQTALQTSIQLSGF